MRTQTARPVAATPAGWRVPGGTVALEPSTIGPAVEHPGVVRSTGRVIRARSEFAGFRFPPEVITLAVRTDRAAAYPRVLDELVPAAQHVTGPYANNRIETDHGRLKARLRPMRGLKRDRSLRIVATGHACVQNPAARPLRTRNRGLGPGSRGSRVHRTGPRRLIDLARRPLPPAPPLDNATEPLRLLSKASSGT